MPGVLAQDMKCQKCGLKFSTITPFIEVLNGEAVSLVIVNHPKPVACPDCGQPHQLSLEGVTGMKLRWVMTEQEELEHRLIVAEGARVS